MTQDGPYRVTGGIGLTDATGADVPRAAGSSREHYALCRCGHSQNKPFCSGMHWYVEFRDPARGADPTLFEWAGGLPALTRMTRLLYEKHVPADDLLAPLFATMAPGYPQREAAVLAEAFGGPAASGEAARRPDFTEPQRARWVALATVAAAEAGLPADPEFRSALVSYLEWSLAGRRRSPARLGLGPGAARPPPSRTAQTSTEPTAAEAPVTLPGPDETVSFAAHVKPLFREHDRKSMTFAFDLWSQADVQAHAAGILERLRNGTMPCDGAWPPEKIEVFQPLDRIRLPALGGPMRFPPAQRSRLGAEPGLTCPGACRERARIIRQHGSGLPGESGAAGAPSHPWGPGLPATILWTELHSHVPGVHELVRAGG